MDVGEVLDFGDWQHAAEAGPQSQAENGLFVEDGVEDAGEAELFLQAAGESIDAALTGDVFAEKDCLRVIGKDVAQRGVDGLRQG